MKRIIFAVLALLPGLVLAAGGGFPLDKAEYDLSDKASLQRGAATFMNYCAGCHSTQYQRYNRVAADIGIPEELMRENLVFTGAKIGDLMKSAMSEKDAARWFGAPPPDLTLVARVRGADWIYTYLRSFYVDETRPFGVNNAVFPSVGMPHVLEPLQGTPRAEFETHTLDGVEMQQVVSIKSDGNGEMNNEEYDQTVLDLVNFLVYSAEPVQQERERMGFWVLGFIAIFFIFTVLLKKEFWRDVH
ncbi:MULTISPECIES: cytochrome c1 [Aeromonas]|jgi:ubiquinol-cytochrome c reductase cytochrome c1 subunit|uniref:Cytochrome c1 n=2 Tax=Aeromonas TaxID=642 RepID=A0A6M4ZJI9_AERME|nr:MULTISPECIES: cytochrome c1 [Aeromonas]AHE51245.1 ubiquinol--cytochrome c reductase, cytochrome c1 [Aeromonas hydrophila 4AK4]MBP8188049.1 cytochrome c1 [Aeromonas sp.]QIY87843.1 cytochrome c1 [Aeromonas hydrophila]MBS4640174.1 cytochrome c1 [Aeromonas media]MBS4701410.1 cytochrome c1 [Aeromonas media]